MSTSDDTPIWFLDVDGVINLIAHACPDNFSEGEACPGGADKRKYPIKWSPRIIKALNQLHDSGKVRIMWLTTWGSGANEELRELIGINKLEVAGEPPLYAQGGYSMWDAPPGGWWKLGIVMKFYEENPQRRYVWTDDQIPLEIEAIKWCRGKPILPISPLPHVTLSVGDLDTARKFLRI